MSYRDDVREGVRETRWTFGQILPTFLLIVVTLGGVGFALNSLGLIGGTIVERKVFENSYQRSEALKSEIAQQQAIISVLERQLSSASAEEAALLKTKILAAEIRLATAKGEQ
jgi:hypothetical protein